MGWQHLDTAAIKEKDLQDIFDSWGSGKNGWVTAGVPKWLHELDQPETRLAERKDIPRYGYSFKPDALWESKRHVAELKAAAKFEPLALAEVLHHAQCLSEEFDGPDFTPVMITQENAWLRQTLAWLFDRGEANLKSESLRFLEYVTLRDGQGRRIMWVEDPLSKWEKCSNPPDFLPRLASGAVAGWRRVEATGCFVCMADNEPEKRPLFMEGPTAMACPIKRSDHSATNEHVFWHGIAPGRGSRNHAASRREYEGRYWLWDGEGDPTEGVPSLFLTSKRR